MSRDEALYAPDMKGLCWLSVVWLCLLAGPLFGIITEYSRYLGSPSSITISDVSATLGQLAFMSLIGCAVGFALGPIVAVWGAYIAISLLLFGLSPQHTKFVLCSSKDWFESDLVSLSLAMMFPASATATYMLFSTFVLKRAAKPQHVGILFLTCAAASQGMLWYYHYLEREVSRYGIC